MCTWQEEGEWYPYLFLSYGFRIPSLRPQLTLITHLQIQSHTFGVGGTIQSVYSSHLIVKLVGCIKSASSTFLGISTLISKVVVIIDMPNSKYIGARIFLTKRTLKPQLEDRRCNPFKWQLLFPIPPMSGKSSKYCLTIGSCQPVLPSAAMCGDRRLAQSNSTH